MAEDEKPFVQVLEELKDRPIVFTTVENFRSYYANSAQFTISFYDIGIVFGQIKEATKERLLIENRVSITVSPEHARALLKALKENIEKYESAYGPIKELPIKESEDIDTSSQRET
jgi:hypothetical protein